MMKRGLECFGHVHRSMVPQEDHHIWPKEFGGPSVPDNMARGCANAHSDTHYYLNLLLADMGVVAYNTIGHEFGARIRMMARIGYLRIPTHLLGATRSIAIARLNELPSEDHETAWRAFSIAYRGCPFGSHLPGEAHTTYCSILD